MNEDSEHIKCILLYAGVIIPELEDNSDYKEEFSQHYISIFNGLESDSQKQLKLLVLVISKLSLLYNLKSFSKLSLAKRQGYIAKLFNFPISKLISGLTGLRALCMIAFYNIESVMNKIHFDGPIK